MIKTKSTFFKGEFLIFLTATLWSFSALIAKLANLNPILLVALRSFFALAVLLPVVKFKFKLNWHIVIGTLCYLGNNISYYIALDYTSAGNAILLCYTAPIFVLIWSSLYFKKKPAFMQLFVLFLTVIGVVIIFYSDIGGGAILGDIIALIGGLSFSGLFFVNSLPKSSSIHSTIYGSFISILFTLFFIPEVIAMPAMSWLWVAVMGGVEIGLAYIFFDKGIKNCSGFNASLISTIEVILGPIWVAVFLHEPIGIYTIIGGVIILASIITNVLYEKKQARKRNMTAV
ncbi:MAG: EamA family transporter [Clostridia bacterium]|nr:EamA family transporter [Clostridia bacterium]